MNTLLQTIPLEEYNISTDKKLFQKKVIHDFLSDSYWAKNITPEAIDKCIGNSLCFGVFKNNDQVGFARVITDKSTFAYLADVFILEQFRGKGLAKLLMKTIVSHEDLQGLRRFILATRDAHGLYKKYGFKQLNAPDRWMEIHQPDIYTKK